MRVLGVMRSLLFLGGEKVLCYHALDPEFPECLASLPRDDSEAVPGVCVGNYVRLFGGSARTDTWTVVGMTKFLEDFKPYLAANLYISDSCYLWKEFVLEGLAYS